MGYWLDELEYLQCPVSLSGVDGVFTGRLLNLCRTRYSPSIRSTIPLPSSRGGISSIAEKPQQNVREVISLDYQPSTKHLKWVHDCLEKLGLPIYFELPSADVAEPFLVIGNNSSTSDKTAQTGAIIEDMTVQIDCYLPGDSRTVAEETRSKIIRALGRNKRVSSSVLQDKSIGRLVYHIVVRITHTIF